MRCPECGYDRPSIDDCFPPEPEIQQSEFPKLLLIALPVWALLGLGVWWML